MPTQTGQRKLTRKPRSRRREANHRSSIGFSRAQVVRLRLSSDPVRVSLTRRNSRSDAKYRRLDRIIYRCSRYYFVFYSLFNIVYVFVLRTLSTAKPRAKYITGNNPIIIAAVVVVVNKIPDDKPQYRYGAVLRGGRPPVRPAGKTKVLSERAGGRLFARRIRGNGK